MGRRSYERNRISDTIVSLLRIIQQKAEWTHRTHPDVRKAWELVEEGVGRARLVKLWSANVVDVDENTATLAVYRQGNRETDNDVLFTMEIPKGEKLEPKYAVHAYLEIEPLE